MLLKIDQLKKVLAAAISYQSHMTCSMLVWKLNENSSNKSIDCCPYWPDAADRVLVLHYCTVLEPNPFPLETRPPPRPFLLLCSTFVPWQRQSHAQRSHTVTVSRPNMTKRIDSAITSATRSLFVSVTLHPVNVCCNAVHYTCTQYQSRSL